MKKTIYSLLMMVGVLVAFTSCEKEEIGNTAGVETAGEWHIMVAAVDPSGEVMDADVFGDGAYNIQTCNTAANVSNKMFIVDQVCYYFPYQVEVDVDPVNLTFQVSNGENLYGEGEYGGGTVSITGGKIVKNGTKTPSGMPADYIEFYVSFSDDLVLAQYLPEGTRYKVSGFRYTGFVEDE